MREARVSNGYSGARNGQLGGGLLLQRPTLLVKWTSILLHSLVVSVGTSGLPLVLNTLAEHRIDR